MKLTTVSAFVVICIFQSCGQSQQNDYCGDSEKLEFSEILKLPILGQTKTIKIGSFKGDSSGLDLHIPKRNGQVDVDGFFEIATLDDNRKKKLIDILVNYDYDPSLSNKVKLTSYFCYDPRNAILFMDNNNHTLGFVELCFECLGNKIEPSNLKIGKFCDEKYEKIKEIFKTSGITYGIEKIDEIQEHINSLKMQLEKYPNNPILLTALASLKMEKEDYGGALKDLDKSISTDSTGQNYKGFFLRGHCKFKLKDFAGAVSDFDNAIKINPRITSEAYKERAQSNIEIYLQNPNRPLKLIKEEICKDLQTVKQSGGNSVEDLIKIYCQ